MITNIPVAILQNHNFLISNALEMNIFINKFPSLHSYITFSSHLILKFSYLYSQHVHCLSLLKLLNFYAAARTFRKVDTFLPRSFSSKFSNSVSVHRMCPIVNDFFLYLSLSLLACLKILCLNFCNTYFAIHYDPMGFYRFIEIKLKTVLSSIL